MALETATYISDLVATNPTHTDGLNVADGHLRMVKTVLQASFPGVNGAVSGTPAQLSGIANGLVPVAQQSGSVGGAVCLSPPASGGTVTVANAAAAAGAGSLVVTITDAGNANPANVLVSTQAGAVAALLSLDAPTIKQSGNALLPTGMIVMWSGSVVSIPAGWFLCNGANGTPDLRGQFIIGAGGAYAPAATGGSAAGSGISDNQGAHTHTGVTALGGSQALTATTDNQGAHSHGAATGATALTLAMIPSHQHGISVTNTGSIGGTTPATSTGTPSGSVTTDLQGSSQSHNHVISSDGGHTHNVTVSSVAAHQHTISSDGGHTHTTAVNTLPPYYALCLIMKS